MKRTAFSRPQYERPDPSALRPVERSGVYSRCDRMAAPVPKECVCKSATYENLVRAMSCIRCGKPPRSQFCHTDEGKGLGIKTDVRRGWPGCAECHYEVGTSGTIPREQKRELEARYAKQTRDAIVNAGDWPAKLPLWAEGETA